MAEEKVKRKPGRPRKSELEKAKKPGKVGRPPGTAARMAEFKARLLVTEGSKVLDTIVKKALKDGDPDQWAALKFCGERILPLTSFTDGDGKAKPLVEISITQADPNAGIHAQQRLEQRRAALAEQSQDAEEAVIVQVNSED